MHNTTYGYDRRGLVTTEQHTINGHAYLPLQLVYDPAGRRTDVNYPTGDKVTTALDPAGRPTSMSLTPSGGMPSDLLSSITHKAFGPITGFTTAAGVTESRAFDTRYRRTSQATALGATTLVGLSYASYDKEGNLLTLNDTTGPIFNRTFGYDPDRYFLTSSTGPYGAAYASQTLSFTYDKNGNRLTQSRTGVGTTTYAYGNDGSGHSNGVLASITQGTATPIVHLPMGDLSGIGTGPNSVSFGYDSLGRLSSTVVAPPGCPGCLGPENAFRHDGAGHRAFKIDQPPFSGNDIYNSYDDFLYGTDGSLYQDVSYSDAPGSKTTRESYVFLEGEPVAILRSGSPGGTYFLHGDHLGRPLAMTDTDGQLVWRGEFEPFGTALLPRLSTAGFEPRFRFPGQWEGGDLGGLQDNFHRAYMPGWGRYTQPDRLGAGDASMYSYALNIPTRFMDPLGLTVKSNGAFLWDFLWGLGPRERRYGPDSLETREMVRPEAEARGLGGVNK